MDTDVLIVGAGPTGLMLANQLARRGVAPLIIDRHSGPAQQSRAMAVQARTMEIYARMGMIEQALALGAVATGANMWANGRWTARIPVGDIGQSLSPFPFVLMLGQDDNERIMGEQARASYGVAVAWNTELIGARAAARSRRGHAQAAGRHRPQDQGRLGRGLRRLAQRGARAERHRLSRRALRAHVLRRRHRGDRADEAGRAQRLSVARRLPPVLPDARQGPLARDRHPARALARARRPRPSTRWCRRSGRRREPISRSSSAAGSRPTASITAPPNASATAAASCSATPPTSTARRARRA